ncbi:MAG: hypothetical protein ACOYLK_18040, partial [Sphingomonas sp.]
LAIALDVELRDAMRAVIVSFRSNRKARAVKTLHHVAHRRFRNACAPRRLAHAKPGFAVKPHQFAQPAHVHSPRRHQRLLRRKKTPSIDKALTFLTCAASHRNAARDYIGTVHGFMSECCARW